MLLRSQKSPSETAASRQTKQRNVVFLLCENMLATSLTLPTEMLKAAESMALAKHRVSSHANIHYVSEANKTVASRSGLSIAPTADLSTCQSGDIIFIPALWRNPLKIIQQNSKVIDWILASYANNARIAGVGTGCFFLAAAGLLNHKPATTHWHAFDLFEEHFPQVHLKRDYFITQAKNLYCAASINSLADLTVFFIKELFTTQIAHQVERHFSHEIRRPFESLSYLEGRIDQHSDENVLQVQLWIQENYARDFKLPELASLCGMSGRTFNRRFKKALGITPLRFLQETRLGVARELIQSTNLSMGEIAYRVGYQDLGHFNTLFKSFFSVTPHEYRSTVRAKLFRMN